MIWKLLIILNFLQVECLDLFHVNSRITFRPDDASEYFGYSVILKSDGLIVGAPKAKNIVDNKYSGQVFICPVGDLNVKNTTCHPLGYGTNSQDINFRRFASKYDSLRNDSWFGATMVDVPDGKLLVCAPRWTTPYDNKFLLVNGACYGMSNRRLTPLYPLYDKARQAFRTDGSRKQYGEYGTHLNFYAYGQAGFSAKVTKNNSVIIGAPGILQWTGGIVEYKFVPTYDVASFSKQPTINPYFTKDLGPDDYFGYSVESGIFEENGTTLYVAGAPRSKQGYGSVLLFETSFRETDPLNIKAKVQGPQLGSYFGASLCCVDINGDGVSDLLVGAPNFVQKNGGLPYDQGAVFVYITETQKKTFTLKAAGYVFGSGKSGARFGSVISDIGDIDGDGFNDIAIGAPWEKSGRGTVYIYKGSQNGLRAQYVQMISVEDAGGFGISISKGFDIDNNNCNDLAIGGHKKRAAYIFRCIPSMQLEVSIKVPDAMNLQHNATNFTALFCVTTETRKMWPHAKIDLKAVITVDHEEQRASVMGDSEYNITVRPGNENCEQQFVEVKPTADLSKPISIQFHVQPIYSFENSSTFPIGMARASEDSILQTEFDIQLTRDCGEDLICRPLLQMTLEPFESKYTPGEAKSPGFRVIVINKEEPSYGAKVHIKLPSSVARIPSECSIKELNLTCNVPGPLPRFESVSWDIELEYTYKDNKNKNIVVIAELEDPLNVEHKNESRQELVIEILPKATFSIIGKALPNDTVTVQRTKLQEAKNVTFIHHFEVTNFGPSDWFHLPVEISLSEKVNLTNQVKGCSNKGNNLSCDWFIAAKVSLVVAVPLRFDLSVFGDEFKEQGGYNVTTSLILILNNKNQTASITTSLILEPATPFWPIIVGCVFGILLLTVIVYVLYKYGFFSRKRYTALQETQHSDNHEPSSSSEIASIEKSTEDLIVADSESED